MSEPDMTKEPNKGGVKTLAIRLDPALHAQLTLIASLRDTTLTEEIRAAIEEHLERAKTAPDMVRSANTAMDNLQEEVQARKAAIAALFGDSSTAATPEAEARPGRGHSRGASA